MGWITKILKKIFPGAFKPYKDNPYDLCGKDCWEASVPKDYPILFHALIGFLPEGSIMRFEGGYPRGELGLFFETNSIPEKIPIPKGTIWPKSQIFTITATKENLRELSRITENYVYPEVGVHFHVYNVDGILIDMYDAFSDPMFISKKFDEEQIKEFCNKLSVTFKNHRIET